MYVKELPDFSEFPRDRTERSQMFYFVREDYISGVELSEIAYFATPGRNNTDATLGIAKDYAKERDIKSVVVASTTGYTAQKAAEVFKDFNLIVVTHVAGFREPDQQQFPSDLRQELESEGVTVLTVAHAFSGVNVLVDSGSIGGLISRTLRMFCEGVKVAVEIAAMAADAGLVRTDEDIISIGGTGKGADTALLIRPAISRRLFNMRIKKILAKPI